MKHIISKSCADAQAYIVPFRAGSPRSVSIAPEMDAAVDLAINGSFGGNLGETYAMTLPVGNKLTSIILLGLGADRLSVRDIHTKAAQAFKQAMQLGAKHVAVMLDQVSELSESFELFGALARLPQLVGYTNSGLKSNPENKSFEQVAFVTAADGLDAALSEAVATARGTIIARRLCNLRSNEQTPQSLAEDAAALGKEYGFDVQLFDKAAIEELGMESFLSVARGAHNTPPVLIVMRYLNGGDSPRIGLVGKGIVYDSGGYSIKTTPGMKNMFDDMGGAAAVIGAMTAVADQKLKANVIGVIAACENKIAADAYVPGDIIGSMSGKTIEVISADAEGRLTLADAVTYIQRKESCRFVADIATLTGSAKTAVGKYSAAVLTNNEELYASAREASRLSAEKIWRLDNDREMLPCIKTPVADLKNAGNATIDGGGCMLGGMFVGEFIENNIPWIHIDMAPVNFRTEPPAYCAYGATGYGASLLYHLVKQLKGNA